MFIIRKDIMKKLIISIFIVIILANIYRVIFTISSNDMKIKKYNSEIVKSISLSKGVKKLKLVNEQDRSKIKKVYDTNLEKISIDSVDITSYLKPFLEELEANILLKYNYKYYRNEVNTNLAKHLDIYSRYKLKQSDVNKVSKLCIDIDELYYFANRDMEVYDVLEKTHKLCEEYRFLSVEQKRGVYNDAKLAKLVEEFGGSLETNFDLEFSIWKVKNSIDGRGGEYQESPDESLEMVQGKSPYSNVLEDDKNLKIQENKYDIEETDFDDLGTFIQIPGDYYDCIVDEGSANDNYINEEKLLRHIANIDGSRLYIENSRIYLKISTNMEDIQLLNWGKVSYYEPNNMYRDYFVKDYEYMDNGRFRVGLMSIDKLDYQIIEGYIKKNRIYFDNIVDNIPRFEKLHVEIMSNRGRFD